ncbi:MAG: ribosome small subunit-dependent GTPase A [Candidatus Eisenbacteria bacterium]|nr:ribosome small subunit-dependent GTPase A [Candidatus Eisenbacteria bacterium]
MSIHQEPSAPNAIGLVTFASRDHWEVLYAGRRRRCRLAGALRRAHPRDEPVVGDRVRLRGTSDTEGLVTELLERRNRFSRRAAGPRPYEQVIAANLDRILIILAAARPRPRWALLDRYLVAAEAAGIPAIVCLNKCDLDPAGRWQADIERYRGLGYEVRTVSAEAGGGIAELGRRLRHSVSLLAGPSGTGKTRLLQALGGDRCAAVGVVQRKTGKGRHTTSAVRLHRLAESTDIIDAPGFRELALLELPPDRVADGFPELREAARACRFQARCTHTHEPDCGVKAALRQGSIHPERYRSYRRLIGRDGGGRPGAHGARERAAGDEAPGFVCDQCGLTVPAAGGATAHRNHCPLCLWSRHVDHRPGDRAAGCGGGMEPVAVSVRPGGEWAVIHCCRACGALHANRVAGDDDETQLLALAARPLAQPPFPLDRLPHGGQVVRSSRTSIRSRS